MSKQGPIDRQTEVSSFLFSFLLPCRADFLGDVWTIAKKDMRMELRRGEVLLPSLFFAFLVVVVCLLSCFLSATPPFAMAPCALWLSLTLASLLTIGGVWERERENRAFASLLLAPLTRESIFLGKSIGIFSLLCIMEIFLVPLVALLCPLPLAAVCLSFLCLLLLGNIGIAVMGTLFGAATLRSPPHSFLLPSVLLPLLCPSLLCAIAATTALFKGASNAELVDWFALLALFDAAGVALGLAVFDTLVEE